MLASSSFLIRPWEPHAHVSTRASINPRAMQSLARPAAASVARPWLAQRRGVVAGSPFSGCRPAAAQVARRGSWVCSGTPAASELAARCGRGGSSPRLCPPALHSRRPPACCNCQPIPCTLRCPPAAAEPAEPAAAAGGEQPAAAGRAEEPEETVFYEGSGGAPAELALSILLGFTILYLPLTLASVGRRLWVSYK